MMYTGELLNSKFLGNLNRTLIVMGALFGLTVGALGIGALMEQGKISAMKEEISQKSKAIVVAQDEAKQVKAKPESEKVPVGLAAVGAFQNKLNKIAVDNGCSVTQFQASDQMNPFISTFVTASAPNGQWTQVEVKMNLQGTTRAVTDTLVDLNTIGIPYEFTSVEMSRSQAGANGEATVTANISLRVLTIPGGA